jgi:hypothetical protein
MTDDDAAIEEFLSEVETVYGEYDQGYMDADAALARIRDHVEELEESVER